MGSTALQVEGQRRRSGGKRSGVVTVPRAGQSEAESRAPEQQPEKAALDPGSSRGPDSLDWSHK